MKQWVEFAKGDQMICYGLVHPKKKKGYYSGRGDKMHETNGQNKHVSGGPFPSSLPSSSNSSSDGLSSGSQCSISTTSSYNSHSSSRSASSFSAVIPQATSSRYQIVLATPVGFVYLKLNLHCHAPYIYKQ